jgi:adenine-specific DNA-methyltransferase
MSKLEYFVQVEEDLFHKNVNYELMGKYLQFIDSFPTYPSNTHNRNWNPITEINDRKEDNNRYPFCLFTSYFANIYFGLRQCIEIDSLRYAIEKIKNIEEKNWALGTLIATTSSLASNYGGHFAQPIKITESNFAKIIESRSQSIFHEFSIRFINLALESEKKSYKIELLPGPFLQTLTKLEESNLGNNGIMIYVDAPYKRDEYSRYYHLLETLVQYNYPSSFGNGRVPKKGDGERFGSEFFTRNFNSLNEIFINLFSRILQNGWKCAWSYSNNGDANMKYIIEQVHDNTNCKTFSYSVPYVHRSQGRRGAKNVTEFLIFFIPI